MSAAGAVRCGAFGVLKRNEGGEEADCFSLLCLQPITSFFFKAPSDIQRKRSPGMQLNPDHLESRLVDDVQKVLGVHCQGMSSHQHVLLVVLL